MTDLFTFETVQLPDGRRVLHFPYMAVSDTHLGAKFSRAKRLCTMLHNTQSDRLDCIGDIVDGVALAGNDSWHFGPYHRQALAEFLQRADDPNATVNYFPGNHDEELRGRRLRDGRTDRSAFGKNLFGIKVAENGSYTDPSGRTFFIEHGDEYGRSSIGNINIRKLTHAVGNTLYDALYEVDTFIAEHISEQFSIANHGKRLIKSFLNNVMGNQARIADRIKALGFDGHISGHTHMGGFERMNNGLLLINDGCSTEQVETLVHDREGRWAVLEWHRNHVKVLLENGASFEKSWAQLGVPEFAEHAELVEDAYTRKADRLLRLVYLLWPPKERAHQLKALQAQERLTGKFKAALDRRPLDSGLKKAYDKAAKGLDDYRSRLRLPILRPAKDPALKPGLTLIPSAA
jgi:UDP-2,3-diacylglucosamine pyrophosphatase LpxH